MSADEQHRATKRAREHRETAERIAAWAFTDSSDIKPVDIQLASGLAAIVHLLLAIEDRLAYGSESILSGTVSCKVCRVILLEPNAEGHYKWHEARDV